MSLLNRFKSKKEQEVQKQSAAPVEAALKEEKAQSKEQKGEKKKESKKTKLVREMTARVILQPLVTEKAAHLSAMSTYVFVVDRSATRVQIAQAFMDLYGVRPVRVNTVQMRANPTRFGRRMGKQVAWKKAFVTLPKGKEVQIYEAV